ncbi:two-component system activity regulator YycH [Bacillus gobiensis]|uniref:YycH family regulatory protein n=1 Tax=Bacillus gobiensis TaxID=1441095 RepID=UPI003D22844D
MNRETLKSYFLIFLILVSCFFTYNIWTYQPLNQATGSESETSEKEVISTEKRDLSDLVRPNQMFFHNNGLHYGLNQSDDFDKVWEKIRKWNVTNTRNISESMNQDDINFPSWLYGEDDSTKLVLSFSDELPIDLFRSLFQWTDESYEAKSFDQIVIPSLSDDSNKRIYLVSSSQQVVIEATVEAADFQNLMAEVDNNKQNYPTYFTEDLEQKQKQFFLPNQPLHMDRRLFATKNYSSETFKSALFDNLKYVKQESGFNKTLFTDGIKLLQIIPSQKQLQFQNRKITPTTTLPSAQLIRRSLEYLNSHGGWTDNYQFFYMTDRQEVYFNMQMDHVPVLNNPDNSYGIPSIELQWSNEELWDYKRPTFSLDDIPLETNDMEIMSGSELVKWLKDQSTYKLDDIDQITPAYMLSPSEQDRYVVATPVWSLVLKNGQIVLLTENLMNEKGEGSGVE